MSIHTMSPGSGDSFEPREKHSSRSLSPVRPHRFIRHPTPWPDLPYDQEPLDDISDLIDQPYIRPNSDHSTATPYLRPDNSEITATPERQPDHDNATIGENPPAKSRFCVHPILLRDLIMGFSDRLTVPFALTAGLSLLGDSRVVLTAGIAELISGSISMGLGAYLASTTDRSHYYHVETLLRAQIGDKGLEERTITVLLKYGVSWDKAYGLIEEMKEDGDGLIKFLLEVEQNLEEPTQGGPRLECFATGMSYWLGGAIPMIPYLLPFLNTRTAFYTSIVVATVTSLVFGGLKGRWSGLSRRGCYLSALHMFVICTFAAASSYGCIKGLQQIKLPGEQ